MPDKDYASLINECKFWMSDDSWDYQFDGADGVRCARGHSQIILDLLNKLGVDTSAPYDPDY